MKTISASEIYYNYINGIEKKTEKPKMRCPKCRKVYNDCFYSLYIPDGINHKTVPPPDYDLVLDKYPVEEDE